MAQILLVEDEGDLRENLKIVLSHAGHEVTEAANGEEALSLMGHAHPDLVISDISMPVMDGLTFVHTVRKTMPGLADLPIVLLTALGDKEHTIEGRSAGADEYLTKPIDYKLLSATIDARLARARQSLDLKERQFVRLFKELSAQSDRSGGMAPAAAAGAATRPSDPFDRIRAMGESPLHGRLFPMHLEDHVPNWSDLPPAMRAKGIAVMNRVLADGLGGADASVELAAGCRLVVLAAADREMLDSRRKLLEMRLNHALGTEDFLGGAAAGGGAGGGNGEDGQEVRLDRETRKMLQALFAQDAAPDGAPDGDAHGGGPAVRHTDFSSVAHQFIFDYVPVWQARSQKVGAYRLRWRRRFDGAALFDDAAFLAGGRDPMVAEIVCLALDAAVGELKALTAQPAIGGALPFIVVPIPGDVLSLPAGRKVSSKLRDLTRCAERRRLGFQLLPGTGTAGMQRLNTMLREVNRLVFGGFDPDGVAAAGEGKGGTEEEHPLRYLATRSSGFGASVQNATQNALMENIRQAARQGQYLWVGDVDTSVAARRLASAGAVFFSGKSVGPGRPRPGRPRKLSASQVFMTL